MKPLIYSILTWAHGEDSPPSIRWRKALASSSYEKLPRRRRNPRTKRKKRKWETDRETLVSLPSTKKNASNELLPRRVNPSHTVSFGRTGSPNIGLFLILKIHSALRSRAHEPLMIRQCRCSEHGKPPELTKEVWDGLTRYWRDPDSIRVAESCSASRQTVDGHGHGLMLHSTGQKPHAGVRLNMVIKYLI